MTTTRIEGLLAGIDYISKVNTSKLKQFEAIYRTKGDLRITVFNTAQGIDVGVAAGRVGSVGIFFELDKMPEFRKLIVVAKAAIDAIRT